MSSISRCLLVLCFFNATATTEIYTLSLHDALPICLRGLPPGRQLAEIGLGERERNGQRDGFHATIPRSEEHTSELQSRQYLVCRLLLEKKKSEYATTFL